MKECSVPTPITDPAGASATARIRAAVAELRRSGLLKANETAAFDTPASFATSAMRARPFLVSTRSSSVVAGRLVSRGPPVLARYRREEWLST